MRDDTVGVYVHIPFCERVCPYCDFAVVAAREVGAELEDRYVAALLREFDSRREAYAGRRLASLYLGGGTPALLTPGSIARIVRAVRGAFPSSLPADEAVEITLEINPSTVERSRLGGFREAGVNRISLGVQSFDDGVLKRLDRGHRAEEAHRTLEACGRAGFGVVSLDLIFAAPGQSQASFESDLEAALAHRPQHLSTYELTVEPGTPFELARRRGQLELPSDEGAATMMEFAQGRLAAAGFERYEISNYARPGFAAVHNRRYWERRPVLGLGVGAFSTHPAADAAPYGSRRGNVRDLRTYLMRVEQGKSAAAAPDEAFDAAMARGEAVFLALRGAQGLSAAGFVAEFGAPPRAFFAAGIERGVKAGLLDERAGGDLRLTARGRTLSDSVFAEFV